MTPVPLDELVTIHPAPLLSKFHGLAINMTKLSSSSHLAQRTWHIRAVYYLLLIISSKHLCFILIYKHFPRRIATVASAELVSLNWLLWLCCKDLELISQLKVASKLTHVKSTIVLADTSQLQLHNCYCSLLTHL